MIKTAELKDKALDWSLAKTKVSNWAEIVHDARIEVIDGKVCITSFGGMRRFIDHTDLATCLESIKDYKLEHKWPVPDYTRGTVLVWGGQSISSKSARGKTLEEAVARCVVAMRLGDEVEVPSELVGENS